METFITIMAIAFALFLIYKFVKATNRHNASKAFVKGYFCTSPDELRAIVTEYSRPAFVSMNVASALLGRLAAKETPTSTPPALQSPSPSNGIMIMCLFGRNSWIVW